MPNFAVCRGGKCSAGKVSAATEHNLNRDDVLNADPSLRHLNQALIGSGDIMEDVLARLNETEIKPRANACYAIEFVMTFSPEWAQFKKGESKKTPGTMTLYGPHEKLKLFQESCIKFLQETYGKKNVVSVNLHMDERTPHLHAFVVPIVEKNIAINRDRKHTGKEKIYEKRTVLSGRDVMGGPEQMAQMQTNFAQYVAHLGLQRGIESSGAKHTDLGVFYKLVNDTVTGSNADINRQLLEELGNRRKSKDRSELDDVQKALKAAGLTVYQGKVMKIEEAQALKNSAKNTNMKSTTTIETKDAPIKQPKTPVKKATGYKPKH